MVLDGHFVSDADVDDQLDAGVVGIVATRTVAFEWPLVFVTHVSFEVLLPNALAEVRHG